MKDNPFVSVIVITKNRPEHLDKCLHSLEQQRYRDFETIVVDSSDDEKSKDLVKQCGNIKYVRFPNGSNMPASRNLGIKASCGEILAFLDDDSFAYEDWLSELLKGYTDNQVGGAGGSTIDESAVTEPYNGRMISEDGNIVPRSDLHNENIVAVDFLSGSNMSFRKSAVIEAGGFDPNYRGSSIMEEVDFCLRIKKIGHRIIFCPKANVVHEAAPRIGVPREYTNFRTHYYMKKNHIYMLFKNVGPRPRYIKNFFYWDIIAVARHIKNNPSIKSLLLLFVNLIGKLAGIVLWIRKGRKHINHLKPAGSANA